MSGLKSLFTRFGARKTVSVSLTAFVVLVAAGALYLNMDKLKRGADVNVASTGPITNQATLSYVDSQQQPKEVHSNTVQTSIVTAPAEATFTFTKAGWYLFALEQTPIDGAPETVFNYDCPNKTPFPGGMDISGKLYRWDNPSGGLYIFDEWGDCKGDGGPFGNFDTGMGFWALIDGDNVGKKITYALANANSPKTVDIGKAGWAIIGNPFTRTINADSATDIKFIKAGVAEEKTWAQAATANWIEPAAYKWDWQNQGLLDFGCTTEECYNGNGDLEANQGAWIQLKVDGVSIKFNP